MTAHENATNPILQKNEFHAGLIGAGIRASRSPFIHMTEARDQGLDLTYEIFDLDEIEGGISSLPNLLSDIEARGFAGVNITHPVKQTILPLLSDFSEDTAIIGACNTVVFDGGMRHGYNTDWAGFTKSFRLGIADESLESVVQLGAGGAGAAIAYALIRMGARRIAIYDVDTTRSMALVARLKSVASNIESFKFVTDIESAVTDAAGIINCSPVGMEKLPGVPIPVRLLRPDLWVADVVYFPLQTELLKVAAGIGCRTLGGGGMVVFQAACAFRLFTGRAPDVQRMLCRFEGTVQGEGAFAGSRSGWKDLSS